jgi:hypothetical protein
MGKAFDWKRSRISMLEVEAVPQSSIPLSSDWSEYWVSRMNFTLFIPFSPTDSVAVMEEQGFTLP